MGGNDFCWSIKAWARYPEIDHMLNWFGRRYPSLGDLESLADAMGVPVAWGPFPGAAYLAPMDGGPALFMPSDRGPLETVWLLAHELGHLRAAHEGKDRIHPSRKECQASRWAACALIPEARILHHGNASEDAFMGALSAHFEMLPYEDCPARELACRIARTRMQALE